MFITGSLLCPAVCLFREKKEEEEEWDEDEEKEDEDAGVGNLFFL